MSTLYIRYGSVSRFTMYMNMFICSLVNPKYVSNRNTQLNIAQMHYGKKILMLH